MADSWSKVSRDVYVRLCIAARDGLGVTLSAPVVRGLLTRDDAIVTAAESYLEEHGYKLNRTTFQITVDPHHDEPAAKEGR